MKTAHHLYILLSREHEALRRLCEESVTACSPEQAQARLQPVLKTHLRPDLRDIALVGLEYPRFAALLQRRLAGLDLTNEDFSGMCLDHFDLTGARLSGADLSHSSLCEATFREADLSRANCEHATLESADLRGADLTLTNLRYANLTQANLGGATLLQPDCTDTCFGGSLLTSAETILDRNNHALISMVLLSRAQTFEQEQFALAIRHRTSTCWPGFTRLLVRQRHLAPWVQETLGSVASLASVVQDYAAEFQRISRERSDSLDVSDIDLTLDALLRSAWQRHPSLGGPDLFWYLSGVLTTVCEQEHIHLSETQHTEVMARFQRVTGWHGLEAEGE